MPSSRPSYTREEAASILERALNKQLAANNATSHEELVGAASEVGVARSFVDEAALEELHARETRAALVRDESRRKAGLRAHAIPFVLVNLLLLLLNLQTGGPLWFFVVLLGWGVAFALHANAVLFPSAAELDNRLRSARAEADRELRRHAEQLARVQRERENAEEEARKEALRKGAAQFTAAVEEGVTRLLAGAADKLRGKPEAPSEVSSVETPKIRVVTEETRPPAPAAPEPTEEAEEAHSPGFGAFVQQQKSRFSR